MEDWNEPPTDIIIALVFVQYAGFINNASHLTDVILESTISPHLLLSILWEEVVLES